MTFRAAPTFPSPPGRYDPENEAAFRRAVEEAVQRLQVVGSSEGVPGPKGDPGDAGPAGPAGPEGPEGPPGTTDYNELDNIPSTFPPSAHTHPVGEVTGDWPWARISSIPAFATRWPAWDEVTSKPSTFPPSAHTHPFSQITGQIAKGQTPLTTTGDLLFVDGVDGGNLQRLPLGSNEQVLKVLGGVPTWGAVTGTLPTVGTGEGGTLLRAGGEGTKNWFASAFSVPANMTGAVVGSVLRVTDTGDPIGSLDWGNLSNIAGLLPASKLPTGSPVWAARVNVRQSGSLGFPREDVPLAVSVGDAFARFVIQSERTTGNIGSLSFYDHEGSQKGNIIGEVDGTTRFRVGASNYMVMHPDGVISFNTTAKGSAGPGGIRTSGNSDLNGIVRIQRLVLNVSSGVTSFPSSSMPQLYRTDGGSSFPFNTFGHLVIQPRTDLTRHVVIATYNDSNIAGRFTFHRNGILILGTNSQDTGNAEPGGIRATGRSQFDARVDAAGFFDTSV